MKNILSSIALACLILAGCSCAAADGDAVPESAKKAFAEKFKGTTPAKWVIEKDKDKVIYEAQWKEGDVDYEAEFDADGKFLLKAHSINVSELPAAVTEAIAKKIPDGKIKKAVMEEGETTSYEVTVKTKDGKKAYDVSADGTKITEDAD